MLETANSHSRPQFVYSIPFTQSLILQHDDETGKFRWSSSTRRCNWWWRDNVGKKKKRKSAVPPKCLTPANCHQSAQYAIPSKKQKMRPAVFSQGLTISFDFQKNFNKNKMANPIYYEISAIWFYIYIDNVRFYFLLVNRLGEMLGFELHLWSTNSLQNWSNQE